MDSANEITRPLTIDPEQAARVIRAIGNIEKDYFLAAGPLSERLISEAGAVIRQSAPEPWEVTTEGWEVMLVLPDWKSKLRLADAWLEIAEIAEGDDDHSWIAAAIGAGSTCMCLEVRFRPGLTDVADELLDKPASIARLLELGFQFDQAQTRLYIPIAISADALAKGFRENDLDKALLPVRKAVDVAIAAKAELDALLGLVREQGKKR